MKTKKAETGIDTKGKRKGGTRFPRYSLKHLSNYLNAFASKTHTSTINIDQLNAGVFKLDAKSGIGHIKASALKQFDLMKGDFKALKATEVCTQITNSDGEERKLALQAAFKKAKVFVNALETFQNTTTEKSKIAQYAVTTLNIHPDLKDDFVDVLIESAEIAGLCSLEGTAVLFTNFNDKVAQATGNSINEAESLPEENEKGDLENDQSNNKNDNVNRSNKSQGHVSNINVNIDVDPSMDPEKLEKLLRLLKNYGAI